MNRVLVTGPTGFIGYEVSRQLVQMGLRPRLLVRRPWRGALLASWNVEITQGDLEQPESLSRALDGIDTVIHLAARAVFEEYALVRSTIVDGSIALMKAARMAGVQRFLFASSLLVYKTQASSIDSSTPAGTNLGYGRAKLEAESALSRSAREAGIALAIIRLPHVYGARDTMFNEVSKGRVFFPGSGENRFAHLNVVDAARLIIRVCEKEWTGITPVADNLPATWNEFFDEIRRYYPRFRCYGVPRMVALLGTQLLSPFRRLRGFPSFYTPDAVRRWNLNLPIKEGLLWNEIDLQPKYPAIQDGIPTALDECVAFRWTHPVADR